MAATLEQAEQAIARARKVVDGIADHLAGRVASGGKVSSKALDAIQPEAFGFARRLAEVTAAESLVAWGRAHGAHEQAIATVYAAQVISDLASFVLESGDGIGQEATSLDGDTAFVREALSTEALVALGGEVLSRDLDPEGARGLTDDHLPIAREFARFADEQVAPLAEDIHRHDKLIPEPLLKAMAELGVFGISIPEEYGGAYVDHTTMIVATEELSRASLGAGGSVITRPEIAAKAVLAGGSDAQKKKWLPLLASGEKVVSVAVTEPDAGSDVARVKVAAKKTGGGYLISGEKTWCTFAGRADVFLLLARTGSVEDGHRGLSLFLVEKPGRPAGEGDEYHFVHTQPDGGRVEGRAIPTVGYRGMHSFSVAFDDYFVPAENLLGEEGRGFYLQMKGFEGGRIQTAARALGVMEAAFRAARTYAKDRKVFGHALADYALTRAKLATMVAKIQAGRQLAYVVGRMMDDEQGSMEASLVKFLTCRDAEWVTREAMQLHGGMGYSEEYAVSRYWEDARVLSIFEGAEEVLGVLVIARQALAARGK